jgi:hypothetical protein
MSNTTHIPTPVTTADRVSTSPGVSTPTHRRPVRLRDVVRGEWIKFRSVRSTRWTLVVAGVVTVAFGMIFAATAGSGEAPGAAARLTGPVELSLGAIDLSAMIVGVLGVLLVAGEYATGLIRTTLAAVGDRLSVLAAKAVVLAGGAAIVMAIAAALALWLGQAVYSGDQATLSMNDADTLRILLGTTAYVTGIGLIGIALGAIVRSTASAIAILVGAIFIGPPLLNLLPEFFSDVVLKYLPSEAGSAMMSSVSDTDLLSTPVAWAVFAAWVVGFLVVAGVLLRTRDA